MTGRKQRRGSDRTKGTQGQGGSDSPREDSAEPAPGPSAPEQEASSKGAPSPRSSSPSKEWVAVPGPSEVLSEADQASDSDLDALPRPSSAARDEPARRLFSPSASAAGPSRPSASPSTPGSDRPRPTDLFFTPGPSASAAHNQAHKRVIEEVRQVYADRDRGLSEMIRELKLPLLPPRERVSVLIIGNHSAGKSSFINWYIDELVQKESVAMETTGFVFVSHGPARATLKGRATQKQVEYLEGIEQFDNALQNLSTEVCASRARRFPMVDFIDTPGLTDGYLRYAFDINEIIVWMAPRVDLIFVFFDPHGQAMCARTMAVVDRLSKMADVKNKLHFFLTRADEIKTEAERSKVMAQVSQTLGRLANADASESPRSMEYKGEHALKVRVIYRPNAPGDMRVHEAKREREGPAANDFNQIYEAVDLIEQAIQGNVAVHCDKLEKQSNDILKEIDRTLETDAAAVRTNKRVSLCGSFVRAVAAVIPLVFSVYLVHFAFASTALRDVRSSPAGAAVFRSVQRTSLLFAPIMQGPHRLEAIGIAFAVFVLLMLLLNFVSRFRRPQKPVAYLAKLKGWREFLMKALDDRNGGLVHRIFETYSTFKNN